MPVVAAVWDQCEFGRAVEKAAFGEFVGGICIGQGIVAGPGVGDQGSAGEDWRDPGGE